MEQKQVLRVSDGGKLTCAHPVQARMMSSHAWIHYSISTYGQHAEAEGCEVRETNVPPTLPDETTTITRATFDTSSTPYIHENKTVDDDGQGRNDNPRRHMHASAPAFCRARVRPRRIRPPARGGLLARRPQPGSIVSAPYVPKKKKIEAACDIS